MVPETISRSRDMVVAHQSLNRSRDLTTHLSKGRFAVRKLVLVSVNLPA